MGLILRDDELSGEKKCVAACKFGLTSLNANRRADVEFSVKEATALIATDRRLDKFVSIPIFLQKALGNPEGNLNLSRPAERRIKLATLLHEGKLNEGIGLFNQPNFASQEAIDLLALYLATKVSDEQCVTVVRGIRDSEVRLELLMTVLGWSPPPYR